MICLLCICRNKSLKEMDKRMDIINEVVTAMRLVKMYCWERKFSEKVQAIRRKELKCYLYKNSIQILPFRYTCTGTCTCTCNLSFFLTGSETYWTC